MKNILFIVYIIIIFGCSFFLIKEAHQKRMISYEIAELSSVKYGLFNAHQWKEIASEILSEKIEQLNLIEDNREVIQQRINSTLNQFVVELRASLKGNNEGILGSIRSNIVENAFPDRVFNSTTSKITNEIMNIIENPQTQNELKAFLHEKLGEYMNDSGAIGEDTFYFKILETHHFSPDEKEACYEFLVKKKQETRKSITLYSCLFFILALFPFFNSFLVKKLRRDALLFQIIALLGLLIIGISIPMMSIDVKIDSLEFMLLGEKITFQNQTLYYQTKGILEVVEVLIKTSEFKAVLIGLLIFLFSIVNPFSKIGSILYVYLTKKTNAFTHFFIHKASKWSMADVMVVAFFMAFLGISSVLDDLLRISNATAENVKIIPNNNHSSLEAGIIFFAGFVVLSLMVKPYQEALKGSNIQQN